MLIFAHPMINVVIIPNRNLSSFGLQQDSIEKINMWLAGFIIIVYHMEYGPKDFSLYVTSFSATLSQAQFGMW